MNKIKDRPSILETNIFYLIIGILWVTLGGLAQSWNIFIGLIITEYVIILIPVIIYLRVRGFSLKKVLRLNRISIKQAVIIPFIVLFAYPVGMFANAIMAFFLSFFGEVKAPALPIPQSATDFLISFLIFAVSAGICEEVLFRGMVMKAYEGLGVKKAILISGILFGFFHFNIINLLGPIFLGVLFAYIVYKTNSIYSAMLAHLTNNLIATVLMYFIGKLNINPEQGNEMVQMIPYPLQMALGVLMVGGLAAASGTVAYFLLKALPQSTDSVLNLDIKKDEEQAVEKITLLKVIPLILAEIIFILLSILVIRNIAS